MKGVHVRTRPPSTAAAIYGGISDRLGQSIPHDFFKAVSPTSQGITTHGQQMHSHRLAPDRSPIRRFQTHNILLSILK